MLEQQKQQQQQQQQQQRQWQLQSSTRHPQSIDGYKIIINSHLSKLLIEVFHTELTGLLTRV